MKIPSIVCVVFFIAISITIVSSSPDHGEVGKLFLIKSSLNVYQYVTYSLPKKVIVFLRNLNLNTLKDSNSTNGQQSFSFKFWKSNERSHVFHP